MTMYTIHFHYLLYFVTCQGVHVFYTIIDGMVRAGAEEGGKHMDPEDIAETFWRTATQNKSAWTFEVDMRPFCENW